MDLKFIGLKQKWIQ